MGDQARTTFTTKSPAVVLKVTSYSSGAVAFSVDGCSNAGSRCDAAAWCVAGDVFGVAVAAPPACAETPAGKMAARKQKVRQVLMRFTIFLPFCVLQLRHPASIAGCCHPEFSGYQLVSNLWPAARW